MYDLLEFTTENNQLFDYFSDRGTNWRLVSGSSNLGLISLSPTTFQDYRHNGTINIFGAEPGTYIFEYAVSPNINIDAGEYCDPYETDPLGAYYCVHPCDIMTARVEVEILAFDYAGEDTNNVNLCESLGQVDLRSLLTSNGGVITTTGVWTNSTGGVIDNTLFFQIVVAHKRLHLRIQQIVLMGVLIVLL